ncbi:MAG: N-acetylmuramoyl-L-alanine amidase [Lachnospiraceae bacterium]|nr:N-acetylmuramoyl-L-alanine amidase [Lachnospiraceae bacterium]
MAGQIIKKVRQCCISVLALCLVFFAVYYIQSKTGRKQRADAGVGEEIWPNEGMVGQFIQMGSEEPVGGGHAGIEAEDSAWARIFGTSLPEAAKRQEDYCVLIQKQGGTLVNISEEMVYRRISITLEGAEISPENVLRVCGTELYRGIPDVPVVVIPEEEKDIPLVREPKVSEEDTLLSISVEEKGEEKKLVLEFNTVYEVTVTEDDEFLYLSLLRPYERYEKILVLDAGHGGMDPGTSGGGSTEAAINLAVIRYVKEILDERNDIKVYYTRIDDTLPDLSTRVEFANALHADMLISVHCNHSPSSSVNGLEVLYSKLQENGNFTSRYLAELCMEEVSAATGLRQNMLTERSSNLHLMKYCTMPCALIEFGYMSNRRDLELIVTENAQRSCAEAICRVIDEAYAALEEQ